MKFDNFQDIIDRDLSWRKHEISELFMLRKSHENDVISKSLILLIYAHWEGFVKKTSKMYLKYISDKNIKIDELSDNFKAILLKNNINNCIVKSEDFTLENELIFIQLYKNSSKKFKIEINVDDDLERSFINTKHNLKEEIFKRILRIIGLSYKKSIETKKVYIDNYLLANRNRIGHGSPFNAVEQNDFTLSIEDLGKLKNVIMIILDSFRDEILDYASKELYLNANKELRKDYENQRERFLSREFERLGI